MLAGGYFPPAVLAGGRAELWHPPVWGRWDGQQSISGRPIFALTRVRGPIRGVNLAGAKLRATTAWVVHFAHGVSSVDVKG